MLPHQDEVDKKRVKETFRTLIGINTAASLGLACLLLYLVGGTFGLVTGLLIPIVQIPLGFVLASWLLHHKGLSLERQTVTPFVFPAFDGCDSVAELAFHPKTTGAGCQLFVSLIYLAFATGLVMARWRGTWNPREGVPFAFALVLVLLCIWRWHGAGRKKLVASANSQELQGLAPKSAKHVCVAWNQIQSVVLIENFNLFGDSTASALHFKDAFGTSLVRIPLKWFSPEQEEHFLAVVGHHLSHSP